MTASTLLQRHWRAATDASICKLIREARRSVFAFAEVTASFGSLLQSWTAGRDVLEFEHYPANDVVNARSGSQFYYHAHRDGDQEHGHLHLFWHATASGRRRYQRLGRARWTKTEPTHLFAISINARGLPIGLFTVNRWVTDGHWFDAATTMACVERFAMREVEGHELSCRWLNGFVTMYRPLIRALLIQRDRCLACRPHLDLALEERRLEVLSRVPPEFVNDFETPGRINLVCNRVIFC